MTTEKYNRGVIARARDDGYVSLGICTIDENGEAIEFVAAIMLEPQTARDIAFNLSLAAIKAEEITGGNP